MITISVHLFALMVFCTVICAVLGLWVIWVSVVWFLLLRDLKKDKK